MYPRTLSALLVGVLGLAGPIAAQQDSSTVTDRQLRQRIDWALTDTRRSIQELTQLLSRMETLRSAVHTRITRDSLTARPSTPPPGNSGPSPSPGPPPGDPGPLANPAFSDDFEAGARAAARGGLQWKQPGSRSVVAGRGRGGGHALEFSWPATPAGVARNNPPLREERIVLPRLREVWLEYWIRLPDNWNHRFEDPKGQADNNKFLALWADQYSTPGNAMLILEYDASPRYNGQYSQVKSIFRDEQGFKENEPAFKKAPLFVPEMRGVWTRIRVHAKLSSGAGIADGRARLWRGDVLVWDTGRINWWVATAPGLNYFSGGYLFGAANSGFDQPTTIYLDDFKVFSSDPGW